jgi:hypothetical protein
LDPWILEDRISRLTEYIGEAGANEQNAMWQYFGITRRAQEADPDDLEQQQFNQIFRELTELKGMLRSQFAGTRPEERTGTSSPRFGESGGSPGPLRSALPSERSDERFVKAEPEVFTFLMDHPDTSKKVTDSLNFVVKQLKLRFAADSVQLEMTRDKNEDPRFRAIYAAPLTDEADDALTLNALALLYESQSGYPLEIEQL